MFQPRDLIVIFFFHLLNSNCVITSYCVIKGSSKIQGMMVDLPDHYMVHMTARTFQRMRNMKILIVKNAHIFGSPQHLPNNLRLLDWMEYPSSSLPSDFHPKKLVVLNLSHSCFTMQEPFKVYIRVAYDFRSFFCCFQFFFIRASI